MANGRQVDLIKEQAAALAQWKIDNRATHFYFGYRYYPGMAYDAEVARIFKWNLWRIENPDVVPDLAGAMLTELDLSEANLARADLEKASLVSSNLADSWF